MDGHANSSSTSSQSGVGVLIGQLPRPLPTHSPYILGYHSYRVVCPGIVFGLYLSRNKWWVKSGLDFNFSPTAAAELSHITILTCRGRSNLARIQQQSAISDV